MRIQKRLASGLGAGFVAILAAISAPAWSQVLYFPDLPVGFTMQYGASSVSLGAEPGQGATWDWSGLPVAQVIPVEFVRRDSTPFGMMFPNATHAQIVQGQSATNYSYLGYAESSMTFHGVLEGPTTVAYTEPMSLMPFPFADGDTHAHGVQFAWSVGGLYVQRWDSVAMTANGFGTLVNPYESAFEVVRVEMHRAIRDSAATGDATLLVDGVGFWQNGLPLPVAQTYTYHQVVAGDTTFLFSGSECLVDVVSQVQESGASEDATTVYPNPASEDVWLMGRPGSRVEVWNAAGDEVYSTTLDAARNAVDVSNWPPGMYVIRVGRDVRRLVVQ